MLQDQQYKVLNEQSNQFANKIKANEWLIKDSNRDISNYKEDLKDFGILAGSGLATLNLVDFLGNRTQKSSLNYEKEATNEKYGYSNPQNGNYSLRQYLDYLDDGYSEQRANQLSKQDELQAQKLYNARNKKNLVKHQNGGSLQYTLPVTKSLNINLLNNNKFQLDK